MTRFYWLLLVLSWAMSFYLNVDEVDSLTICFVNVSIFQYEGMVRFIILGLNVEL